MILIIPKKFINSVNEFDGKKLVVRVDTIGGSPMSTYGMVAKLNEFDGDVLVKIDGRAYSSGFFFAAMIKNVEALDVSSFLIHRAAYPKWLEESSYFTDSEKENLKRVNAELRKRFEAKVDVEAFEKITGKTLDEIFSMDDRIDVYLSAKEAKKIGLIQKINKLTPTMRAEIDSKMFDIAANYMPELENTNTKQKTKTMTVESLKEEHPEVYEAIISAGYSKKEAEIKAEKEKAEAEAKLREEIRAEEIEKLKAEGLIKLEDENSEELESQKPNATTSDDAMAALEAKLDEELKIKN